MIKKSLVLFLTCIICLCAKAEDVVTTFSPVRHTSPSNNQTGGLYSVTLNDFVTIVTIEIKPTKNLKRLNYWTGYNAYVQMGNDKYPLLGTLVNGQIQDCFYDNSWGWSNVKKDQPYYYQLVFAGRAPEGITDFSLVDQSSGAHGYSFQGYTINNPVTNNYLSYTSKAKFEDDAKSEIMRNLDPVVGIYEQIGGNGYRLAVIKHNNNQYSIHYIDDKDHKSWWHPGEFKGLMEPSATAGAFKIQWAPQKKFPTIGGFATFDGKTMTVMLDNLGDDKYIKMFPNANTSIAGINQAPNGNSSKGNEIWTGTGFALLDNYIATNYHVVDGAKSIKIKGLNGDYTNTYTATLVASDKFNDLAILKLNNATINSNSIPYAINSSISEVGEEVFVLGYPMTSTMGDEIKLTTGVISSRTGFQGDVALYQISAPIQPGNSGGPLFDEKGNIIGIVSAKHQGAENVGYAIKTSYLKNLMESALGKDVFPSTNRYTTNTLSNKVKSAKNFVYYIVCSNTEDSFSGAISNSGGKIYSHPSVGSQGDRNLIILAVELTDNSTILTFSTCNSDGYNSYAWVTMDPNAKIVANGIDYKLRKAEGIAISPDRTYFTSENQTITFKLIFPAIPKNTQSIDFIESYDSSWKFYDIKLK